MALKFCFITKLGVPTNWVTHPLQIPSGSAMLHIREQNHHDAAASRTINPLTRNN